MLKNKVHITPDGPKECNASIKTCTYAQNGGEHYDNMDDAQAAYDKQMKEEHGSFVVKKASAKVNNSDDEINNMDIKDYIDSIKGYKNNLFTGNSLKELKDHINNEYEKYKNSNRNTKTELLQKIIDDGEFDENVTIVKIFAPEHLMQFNPNVYKLEIDEQPTLKVVNEGYGTYDQIYSDYDEASSSLYEDSYLPIKSDRKLLDQSLHTEDEDVWDNYDDDTSLSPFRVPEYGYSKKYYYELTKDEQESLKNQEEFESYAKYKKIIDDPNRPTWAVLPEDMEYLDNSTEQYTLEKNVSNIHFKNDSLDENIEKLNSELKIAEDNKDNDSINNIKEQLKKDNKDKEANTKKIIKMNKQILENGLAARYPSKDAYARRKAAKEWMKNNEDKLPNFATRRFPF